MPQPYPPGPLFALLLPEGGSNAVLGGTEGPDLTRYLLVCAGLLLLVGGLAWAARRFLATTLRARAEKRALRVMDVLPLGGKQRLAVVRCYDRTFLLGLGDKEVSLVSELDGEIEPRGPGGAISTEVRSFSDLLKRAKPRAVATPPAPDRPSLEREGILG